MSRARAPLRGTTLLEVAVSALMLALLTTSLYGLLSLGMTYHSNVRASDQCQQAASLALHLLAADLKQTQSSSLSFGPDSVMGLSPQPDWNTPGPWTYAANGSLQWHKWICFFLQGTDLVRSEQSLAGAIVLPPPPTPPTLASFQSLGAPLSRVVARQIQTISAAGGTAPELIEISVTARVATSSTRFSEVTLRTQIATQP